MEILLDIQCCAGRRRPTKYPVPCLCAESNEELPASPLLRDQQLHSTPGKTEDAAVS